MTASELAPLFTIDNQPLCGASPFAADSVYIANFDQLSFYRALLAQHTNGSSAYEHLSNGPFISRNDPAMRYRGNSINRTKFFAVSGTRDNDDADLPTLVPIYKYPGFQYKSVEQYVNLHSMPFVAALAEEMVRRGAYKGAPLTLNHVIGTHYITGDDGIGFHSDKIQDIQDGSPILMFSFGGRRELWFSKVIDEKPEIVAKFVMQPGSLFVLGPETNRLLKHSIVPERDESIIDRTIEPLKPRISLVMRHISTVLTRCELQRRIAASERNKLTREAAKQNTLKRSAGPNDKDVAEIKKTKLIDKRKHNS